MHAIDCREGGVTYTSAIDTGCAEIYCSVAHGSSQVTFQQWLDIVGATYRIHQTHRGYRKRGGGFGSGFELVVGSAVYVVGIATAKRKRDLVEWSRKRGFLPAT